MFRSIDSGVNIALSSFLSFLVEIGLIRFALSFMSWQQRNQTWLFLSMVIVSAGLSFRASCLSNMRPTEVISNSPIDNLDPEVKAATASSVPAFPGAEGFGANSVGGRGGRVIEVTNLADSGMGSLRAAIEAEGPRIVVFRVGGTIELQSGLVITNPFITIAGQTAPGGGITLRNDPSNSKTPLKIKTHDVVIRYIRSRPGSSTEITDTLDAISIGNRKGGVYNIIIDHSSFSWATDEVVNSWFDAHDITIQWSIVSEGLNCSTHEEGCHSKGMLLGSDGSRNISIHHNLFAHNAERNPLIKTSGLVDVTNNVMYNPKWSASVSTDDYNEALINFVGNYFKLGNDSNSGSYLLSTSDKGGDGFQIFVQGNIGPNRPSTDMDETLVAKPRARQWIVPTQHDAPLVTTTSAFEAYDQVLANAGATIGVDSQGNSYLRRDTVDERIVDDVRNGTGGIINDPSEVGGWPELAAGTAPDDTDHDGMADEWEVLYCFYPNDPSDGLGDADGDGYTNVEEYLNGTKPTTGSISRRLILPFWSFSSPIFRALTVLAGYLATELSYSVFLKC